MRIQEVLVEFEMPDMFKNKSLGDVFGFNITAGDVASVIPNVNPKDAYDFVKKAYDVSQTELFTIPGYGPYTLADAVIDGVLVASDVVTLGAMTPALLARASAKIATKVGAEELEKFAARKAAEKATQTAGEKVAQTAGEKAAQTAGEKVSQTTAKKVDQAVPDAPKVKPMTKDERDQLWANMTDAERKAVKDAEISRTTKKAFGTEVGREVVHGAEKGIQQNVNIAPDIKAAVKGTGTTGTSSAPASVNKRRFKIGDMIPVNLSGKTIKLPITNIVPDGYVVKVDSVPGQAPGSTVTVPEPAGA